MKNKISSALIYIGYLIVIVSVVLSATNIYKDYKSGVESLTALDKIMNELESHANKQQLDTNNTHDEQDSTNNPQNLDTEGSNTTNGQGNKLPQNLEIDETYSDVPTVKVDGKHYMGIIHIPKLSLSLPIQSEWSYKLLDTSACRYHGSVEDNNLVLMSHNYRSQFGHIYKLKMNDEVKFIDVTGNKYKYKVVGSEKMHKSEVDKMINGNWDLTLFTCDFTRTNRTAVRFVKSDSY